MRSELGFAICASVPTSASQVLSITGLRFEAMLGILPHEKKSAQPIAVDAELHLGIRPLLPRGDDIGSVLDYRTVREVIIDECTSGHVNLLETLIGSVATRLIHLPGVLGVRLKVAKLQIFSDCQVAIHTELGQW